MVFFFLLAILFSELKAARNFWLVDKDGLISEKRKPITDGQRIFSRPDMEEGLPLKEVVKRVKPNILLGLSGVGKTFTEEIVKDMAAFNTRPSKHAKRKRCLLKKI